MHTVCLEIMAEGVRVCFFHDIHVNIWGHYPENKPYSNVKAKVRKAELSLCFIN
jgi:hypothetical protein